MSLDITLWLFISSGMFLGWSLGANNAVGLIGTAVSSRMVRFRTAAVVAGIFTIAGSVISGAGTTNTLTALGGVNALAGSFTVALAVAATITWMTKARLPVSTSQAVVGAIIGWNLFTGSPTDLSSLSKILSSWVVSPIIAAIFGFMIFRVLKRTVLTWKIHMLELDNYTRIGLIVVGAMASYSLGANNIANVMGMFVPASPFSDLSVAGLFKISGVHQLFFLGGLAIAVGIFTYGHKVMETVGRDLFKISPITGFAVVLAETIVLTLFTSQTLEGLLLGWGLPSIPLVPLSATQSFIGAVIGVGLAKDPQSIDFRVFGKISIGWVAAPLTAGILAFILLFFVQNVFEQKVIHPVPYVISPSVLQRLQDEGVETSGLHGLINRRFDNPKVFKNEILKQDTFSSQHVFDIFHYAAVDSFRVDSTLVQTLDTLWFSHAEIASVAQHHGKTFSHKLDLENVVFSRSPVWASTGDPLADKILQQKKSAVEHLLRVGPR
ncbi:MAG: inorganic phosphate transporter family protein [Bacteroidetes bacterium]|jgi:PiT family inorganic phosphate transporter|nr:inorganic phosphate transporter family protein [Bacteroidota bacterium]